MADPIRVLVADDSETILLLLRTRLEMEGMEVETAPDGQATLDLISSQDGTGPDLLLLDAMMPGVSGIDVVRSLRESGNGLPVLIISAHQEQDATGELGELEIAGFMRKPIDFEDLILRIRTLTGEAEDAP